MISIVNKWSLRKELCELTGTNTLQDSLTKLSLINDPTTEFSLRESPCWVRGGAETFIYQFWLGTANTEKAVIIKACITLSDIDQTLAEWLRRRFLLVSEGISVPVLYASGNGLIVEEYVPFSLRSMLMSVDEDSAWNLIGQLVNYVAVLAKLKFSPVDFLDDLRSRGNDVVAIDFGQDLGPPSVPHVSPRESYVIFLEKLKDWIIEAIPAKEHDVCQYFLSISDGDPTLSR